MSSRRFVVLASLSASVFLSLWLPGAARAGEPVHTLELSVKAGGHFPQLTSALDTSFDGIVKVGYGITADRRLQLFIDAAYARPSNTVTGRDARLGEMGETYRSTLTLVDLSSTLGAAYFIPAGHPGLLPYAGAGVQIHHVRAREQASTERGVPLGEHRESDTGVGGAAFAGLGLRLGAGLLLGELRFGYAPISQRVTGEGNIGALSVLLGYGFLL
jgi:hypothetical protein